MTSDTFSTTLVHVLKNASPYPVLGFELTPANTCLLNLSPANTDLQQVDLSNTVVFEQFIRDYQNGVQIGFGGYNEHRDLYKRSTVFSEDDDSVRCIHLGVDLWGDAYTPVYTPFDGMVHSFAYNADFGDYGATLILEHTLEGTTFYTLYGHLSLASIANLNVGMIFKKGEEICQFGERHENGNWPPHLHFQVMNDLLGKEGDFPGVAALKERAFYLNICPDPNLILRFQP